MKSPFFKTVFLGLLFIIPLVGLIYLFQQIYKAISPIIKDIMDEFALNSRFEITMIFIGSILLIFVIIYVLGRIAQTNVFRKLTKDLDEFLQNNFKFYRTIKLELDNASGFMFEDRPPIYVAFGDKERPGFLIERKPDEGKAIVFIPKNFYDFNGNVYIVPLADVREANESQNDFVIALSHLGAGLDIRQKPVEEA